MKDYFEEAAKYSTRVSIKDLIEDKEVQAALDRVGIRLNRWFKRKVEEWPE